MKICPICNKEFELKNSKATTRKYCYECSPEGTRSQQISAIRKAMKKKAIELKGGKCENCGYNKCIDALVFHHLNPEEKEFGLAQCGNTHSWEDYLNEVQKCKLYCANCHAEEHYRLNNNIGT